MVVRVHRDLRSRAGRVQLYAVFTILALCAVGGAWQTVRSAGEPNPYLASGRLVTVDGHQLRLECTGSGSSDRRPRAGRRRDVGQHGLHRPCRSRPDPDVRLRPRRPRRQRTRRRRPGRRPDRHRPPHAAAPGGRPGPLRACRALLRRPVRAHLRRALPRRGRRSCPAGLHRLERAGQVRRPRRTDNTSDDAIGRFATLASLTAPVGLARLYGDLAGGSLPARYEDQLAYDTAQAHTVRSVVDEYLRGGATARRPRPCATSATSPCTSSPPVGHPESWMTDQKQSDTPVDQQRPARRRRRHPPRTARGEAVRRPDQPGRPRRRHRRPDQPAADSQREHHLLTARSTRKPTHHLSKEHTDDPHHRRLRRREQRIDRNDRTSETRSTQTFQVVGMTCDHCARAVTSELMAIAGVTEVSVDVPTGQVTVGSAQPLANAERAGRHRRGGLPARLTPTPCPARQHPTRRPGVPHPGDFTGATPGPLDQTVKPHPEAAQETP